MRKTAFIVIFIAAQTGFGQKNMHVEPFLPDVLTPFPNVRDFAMSSSGDEAWFSVQSPLEELSVIVTIKKKNGKWSSPQILPFSGTYKDLEPFLSPDGSRLYFASNRPLEDAGKAPKDFDIWYVERKNRRAPWSDPINMGKPINSEHNEFYPAIAKNNNLYFTSDAPTSKGKDDIFFSKWENGRYSTPVSLGDAINSEGYEYNAWIAPDESVLIFGGYNRKDGLGSGDLYISKNTGSNWSRAKNLGKNINSKYMDYCPFVDIKTSTLYFTSRRSDIKIKVSGFKNTSDLLKEITKYENGWSRLYKVSFGVFLSEEKTNQHKK